MLYDVWRTNPKLLERYQVIQRRDIFKVGEMLASFVVTPRPRQETLFIGLFACSAQLDKQSKGRLDLIFGNEVSGFPSYKLPPTTGRLRWPTDH